MWNSVVSVPDHCLFIYIVRVSYREKLLYREDDRKVHFKLLHDLVIPFEPAHEIMVLFVLRKLIFQTRLRGHPVGLDVWFLVGLFVYFHTVRIAKALARLRGCTGSPEPSLVAYVISTIISWAGSFHISENEHQYLHSFMTFITNKGSNNIIKHLQLAMGLYNKMLNIWVSDSINKVFINVLNSFVNKNV